VFALIGIFIIVAILVVIRGWLERRYQHRKAEERARLHNDQDN
jgi:hypothetical protein